MIENNKLVFGIMLTVGSTIYLFYLFQRRSFNKGNAWDKSMFFKGMIGGLCGFAIGIVAILMHFGLW